MKVADMHCDTIAEIYARRAEGKECGILENELHMDLKKMEQGDYLLQNFAIFAHMENLKGVMPLPEYAFRLADIFLTEMRKYPDRIGIAKSYRDIEENMEKGRISAVLTMEEGAVFEGKTEYLRIFYELGVRMCTFTWNFPNELAWPNRISMADGQFEPETEKGLTEKGLEFLAEMERLGILADVSHLGDRGIYDVIRHSTRPFVASHSDARAVCGHVRNLTDDMVRGIAEKGGVIGMNYCPSFLRNQEEWGNPGNDNHVSLDDVVRHIRHIMNVGGIDVVGLGSDFDGTPISFEMKGAQDMQMLADKLAAEKFTDSEIEKIFYKNVLRVYREVL